MLTEALAPPRVAVSTTCPRPSAATHPPAVTTATRTSLVFQSTVVSGRGRPAESSGAAVRTNESPARTDFGGVEIWMAAAGSPAWRSNRSGIGGTWTGTWVWMPSQLAIRSAEPGATAVATLRAWSI
jgi:hypothetical protein